MEKLLKSSKSQKHLKGRTNVSPRDDARRKKAERPKDSSRSRSSNSGRATRISAPVYGSSFSWDSTQGQALVERMASHVVLPSSTSEYSKESPYMALVQLFNQFQGMPVDAKKMLVTVTVLGSTGPLRMVMGSDATVNDVIFVALLKYAHEGRVPSLGRNAADFDLYASEFSSQASGHEALIVNLGSRRFVLCPRTNIQMQRFAGEKCSKSWWSYMTTGIKALRVAPAVRPQPNLATEPIVTAEPKTPSRS